MKIRFLGRTIEVSNGININKFKHEKILIGVCFRKIDIKKTRNLKKLFLYCFMPYGWLNKQCCNNKL